MRFLAKHRRLITWIVLIICGCGLVYLAYTSAHMDRQKLQSDTYAGSAMGTAIKKTFYSVNAASNENADQIVDQCLKDLESEISVRDAQSEISKCNSNYAVDGLYELPEDLLQYLQQILQIYEETDGALNPCLRPVANLWGIEDGNGAIPDAKLLEEALTHIDAGQIELNGQGIIFHAPNMMLDFGATGKGIACDVIAKKLQQTDVQGAVVSVGGSILTYGDKGDGKLWHIGIQDPRDKDGKVLGVVDVEGGSIISTSGDYEKYFEQDGKRYHHIFDPSTGYPADNGLISVSIIGKNGLETDALSTACFVMGLKDGMAYAQKKGVDAVFVDTDKNVYITDSLKKRFNLKADGYKVQKLK